MSEWIRTKDEMPRDGKKVLVWFEPWYNPSFITTAVFSRYWEFLEESGARDGNGNVTHWMPLPSPPDAP